MTFDQVINYLSEHNSSEISSSTNIEKSSIYSSSNESSCTTIGSTITSKTNRIIHSNNETSNTNPMEYLIDNYDQLTLCIQRDLAFRNFDEPVITFPPTYKYDVDSDVYETQLKRIPSFTDRILYRSKRLGHIVNYQYNYVPSIRTSDHRPVFGLFKAQLMAGKDDIPLRDCIPLNAGSFNRDVYLEGLRRRAIEAGRNDTTHHDDCAIS